MFPFIIKLVFENEMDYSRGNYDTSKNVVVPRTMEKGRGEIPIHLNTST